MKSPLLFDWTWFKIETLRIRLDNVEMKKEQVENDTFIACFYGGAILGIGVTCVFKAQSTSA